MAAVQNLYFSIKNEDFDTKQKTQALFTELRERLSQLVT